MQLKWVGKFQKDDQIVTRKVTITGGDESEIFQQIKEYVDVQLETGWKLISNEVKSCQDPTAD